MPPLGFMRAMTDVNRRNMVAALAMLGLLPTQALAAAREAETLGKPAPFSWELLQARAQALARQAFRPPETPPETMTAASGLGFDEVGLIGYRPDKTLAGGIRLFPVGRYASHPVRINVVEGGAARPVIFSTRLFQSSDPRVSALGISGFRAVTADGRSDWMAFMGASYFRASGSQDQYGLSARGIAIDTGIAGREEFPSFTDFWIEHRGGQSYVVHALLDGPSITGAYRFQCGVGDGGVVQDVSAVLFCRRDIARLGIAPATSMFWYGEGNRAAGVDWRPEIHDSDGLAMWTGRGERIWRFLDNPKGDSTNSFLDENPKGFGLMQRDRRFEHYQDDGAFYDRRPNLWVEPRGAWGKGAVMLYEFGTDGETVDNVVAFWVPAKPVKRGDRLSFDYRLRWTSDDLSVERGAHAVDSWRGVAGRPGVAPTRGAEKIVVDFFGDGLVGLDRSSGVKAVIDVARGKLLTSAVYPVVGQPGRWRVVADIAPATGGTADVRMHLALGAASLTETVLTQIR